MATTKLTQAVDWRSLAGQFYVVDVGSRGGFHDMRLLHPLTHLYSLDADETMELPAQRFASHRHFPWALSSSEGEEDLFVTAHPGMSSLLEFDEAAFVRHFGLIPGSESWKQTLALSHRQKAKTCRADAFFKGQGLTRIDFLKLDTQGTELEILKGARDYLSAGKISVIKTEVGFIRVYKNQCTFSEIDQFLKGYGFIFVDCMFYPDSVHATDPARAVKGSNLKERPRFSAVGDAVYVLDPVNHAESDRSASTIRSAIVLNQIGYVSLAFDLLNRCGYESEFVDNLLRATVVKSTFKMRLKGLLKAQLPPWAYRRVQRLYASLFTAR